MKSTKVLDILIKSTKAVDNEDYKCKLVTGILMNSRNKNYSNDIYE